MGKQQKHEYPKNQGMMRIPKRYGEGRVEKCPFCRQQATAVNAQGIPVCPSHKGAELGEMKCVCGEYLDIKKGKFGIFFSCLNCGSMSPGKSFEINAVRDVSESKKNSSPAKEGGRRREMTVRPDDPRYFS